MMMKPKISIVVPVFNVENFLTECVNSIQSQTLEEIEIILVDDGSTDHSSKMCDEFAAHDTRIKVIHKQNEGLGLTRNTGIAHSCGGFIMFVDSDDFIEPNTCEHLYHLMLKNELDVIYYRYQQFQTKADTNSSRTASSKFYANEHVKEVMLEMIAARPTNIKDRNIECSASTALYKKAIIDNFQLNFNSERTLISEDLIFNLDFLSHAAKVGVNNSILYHYRINNTSITHTPHIDRIQKNKYLFEYLYNNHTQWGLPFQQLQERVDRLMIGLNRSTICHFLNSNASLKQKYSFFSLISSEKYWETINKRYPVKQLPLYQRLFFLSCKDKLFLPVLALSWAKKIRNNA